jgi:hypothetical protein
MTATGMGRAYQTPLPSFLWNQAAQQAGRLRPRALRFASRPDQRVAGGDEVFSEFEIGVVGNLDGDPAVPADVAGAADARALNEDFGVILRSFDGQSGDVRGGTEESEDLCSYLINDVTPGVVLPGAFEGKTVRLKLGEEGPVGEGDGREAAR